MLLLTSETPLQSASPGLKHQRCGSPPSQVERDSEDEAFAEDREFILRLIGQIEQADKMPGGEGQAKDEGGRMQDSAREKEPAQDNA